MSACEISMEDLKSNEMQNYRFRENCQDFYTWQDTYRTCAIITRVFSRGFFLTFWPYVWLVFKKCFNQERVIVARLRYVNFEWGET